MTVTQGQYQMFRRLPLTLSGKKISPVILRVVCFVFTSLSSVKKIVLMWPNGLSDLKSALLCPPAMVNAVTFTSLNELVAGC
jgi:hypothetical protein